jgi:hypothetical protein
MDVFADILLFVKKEAKNRNFKRKEEKEAEWDARYNIELILVTGRLWPNQSCMSLFVVLTEQSVYSKRTYSEI